MAQDIAAARKLFDAIKTGAPGISIPRAVVLSRRVWDANQQQVFDMQDPPQPREPTNDEVGAYVIQRVKEFIFNENLANEVQPAATAAAEAKRNEVITELVNDLGEIVE